MHADTAYFLLEAARVYQTQTNTAPVYTTNNNIIIQVSHNGIQLTDNEIKHCFEPYYALGENRFSSEGVGLFFTKMLVEQHINGKLFIKKDGELSIFQLELPFTPPPT